MQHLGVGNCRQYFLNHEEYSEGKTTEYEDYLENLGKDFANDVKHMIKQGLDRRRQGKILAVFNEALQHAYTCNKYLAHFQGQKELLFRVEKFLKDPRRNFRPFVIHGDSGSGKSAVMAKLASCVKSWFAQECVAVTRFLGTTSSSCSIYHTLVSVTEQICCAYETKLPVVDTEMKTLYNALVTFRKVIETVSEKFAGVRPLIIVLDGVDQLLPIEESMKALWAICQMPSNVHIIMSTVTELGELNLAEMLSSMVTDSDSIQPVEPLSRIDVINLIDSMAEEKGKKLTEELRQHIIESLKLFDNLLDPLYIYHSVNETLESPLDSIGNGFANASEILAARLEQMEGKYHPALVKYVTSYLTINPLGIQERELLDVLNCDKSLISLILKETDFFLTELGISAYVWAQIKLDLSGFTRENVVWGEAVMAWNHRLWFAVVAEMYGVLYPGIDENFIDTESTTFTLELHENMAGLYLGQCDESASVVPNLPQPTEKHNTMKLVKLPQHMHILLPVEGFQRVMNHMLFNLQWLTAKIKAFSVQDVLNDLQPVINLAKHCGDELDQAENSVEGMQAMYEFLQLSEEGLQLNPDNLPAEIMARLPAILSKYPALRNLVNSVNDFLCNTASPRLMPVYPCLTAPGSPLRHSLPGSTHIVGLLQEDTLGLLFSQQTGLGIWRLETGELVQRFPVNPEQSVKGVLPTKSGEYILIGHYSHLNHVMDLEVYSVATGLQVIKAQFQHKFEIMRLDAYDEILLAATCMKLGSENREAQRCLLGIDIKSKKITYTIPVTANNVHKHGLSDMMFDKDSLQVLTVGNRMSKDLACWNLESQNLKWKINLDHHAQHVEIAGDKVIVVSPDNGLLTVINAESGETIAATSDAFITGTKDIYISKQSKHLLLGSTIDGLAIMDLDTATLCKTVELTKLSKQGIGEITKITMDPKELSVFVGYSSGAIDVVSVTRGELITRLAGHSGRVTSLVCDKHDSRLLSTSQDDMCIVWNMLPIAERYYQNIGEHDTGR